MWRMSGIHRDVTLLAKPAVAHISDFAVRTPLAFSKAGRAELASARLELDVHVTAGSAEQLPGAQVLVHLLESDSLRPVLQPLQLPVDPGHWYACDTSAAGSRDKAGYGGVARLKLDVLHALRDEEGQGLPLMMWSAEQPSLYVLVLELRGADGSTLECETCQVGGGGSGVGCWPAWGQGRG